MPIEIEIKTEPLSRYEVIPGFSCLALKEQGQELLQERLAGMSDDEVQAYWDAKHTELLAWQAEAKRKFGPPQALTDN